MNNKLNKSFKLLIGSFNEAFSGLKANLQVCGELLVKMLEMREDAFEIIIANNRDGITLATLELLEQVGLGKLDPLLLTNNSPAARKAIEVGLPMEAQQQLLHGTVPVVVFENDAFVTKHKTVDEIKAHESPRVVKSGGIAPPSEQRRELESKLQGKRAQRQRYIIDKNEVTFIATCTFNYAQLMEIAARIAPKATDIESCIKKSQIARPARQYSQQTL